MPLTVHPSGTLLQQTFGQDSLNRVTPYNELYDASKTTGGQKSSQKLKTTPTSVILKTYTTLSNTPLCEHNRLWSTFDLLRDQRSTLIRDARGITRKLAEHYSTLLIGGLQPDFRSYITSTRDPYKLK